MTLPVRVQAASNGDARTHHAFPGRAELLLVFGFWTLLAILTVANRLTDPRGPGLMLSPPTGPMVAAFAESYLWAVLTPIVFWLASRFPIERPRLLPRLLLFIIVGIAAVLLVEFVMGLVQRELLAESLSRRGQGGIRPGAGIGQGGPRGGRGGGGFFALTFRPRFINDLVVYTGVVAAGVARDYFLRYRARQEDAVRLQAEAAQLQAESARHQAESSRLQAQLVNARLAALRTQINPHFLFNTLHAVSSLVERDPRGVRRMIARLSELLRFTLEGADEQEIPLEQELAFLERYLEIIQIRFQETLDVDTHVEASVLDALVPTLILQPLVENAVKHGVSRIEGAGRIEIRGRRNGERVVLTVRDTGPGLPGGMAPSEEGIGLRNTRERLAQLYGSEQSFELRPAEGGGTVAELTLPYHTRADVRSAVDSEA